MPGAWVGGRAVVPVKLWGQAGAGVLLIALGLPGSAWVSLACAAVGAGLIGSCLLGVRLRVLTSALFCTAVLSLAPSAAGEQSSVLGVALGALFLGVVVVSSLVTTGRRDALPRSALLPLALMALYWLLVWIRATSDPMAPAATALEYRNVFLTFSIMGVAVAAALGNSDVVRDCLRLFAASVGVLAAAWWVSLPTFFLASPAPVPRVGIEEWRPLFVYYKWNPLTLTTSEGFFGLPRASMVSGESGAWAVFCLLAAAASWLVFSGRTRTLFLVLSAAGVASSQSSGAFIVVLAAALAVGGLAALRGARIPPSVFMGVLVGTAMFLPLVQVLFEMKVAENAVSFTDRGFASGSLSLTGAFNGSRINLLAAFSVDGLLAVLPFVALLVLLARLVRAPAVLGPVLAVALIGVVLQPLGFHVSAWVLLAMVTGSCLASISRPDPPASSGGSPTRSADRAGLT